jgi:hypothetical protein
MVQVVGYWHKTHPKQLNLEMWQQLLELGEA